ncbi:MAG: ROK family protein [Candidatus Margulisbacteria bacterium]|nr:ROK family protein [Candidatus Margulisiibacteriota bacterium]
MVKNYLALDIGGTKILGAIISDKKIIAKEKIKTNASQNQEEVYARIKNVISTLLKKTSNIEGIGIGIPGRVNDKGEITFSPNLPFENFPLKKKLQKDFGINNIAIDNDVNVGMLGEHWMGAAAGHKDALGIFIGTGIGGAVIINNKLLKGAQSIAGEVGHMKLSFDGPKCNCGEYGCLEAYASKIAMQKFMEEQGMKFNSILKSSTLKTGIAKQNKIIKDAVKQSAYYLGEAIGSLVNCLDPEVIVLGGGVPEAIGEYLLKKIEPVATARALVKPNIKLSMLGDEAGLFGAVKLLISDKE